MKASVDDCVKALDVEMFSETNQFPYKGGVPLPRKGGGIS